MIGIEFQTLKIRGFAGIQDLTIVKLDDPGLNVITGPNGATKTTRFSALVWCCYGTPLKPKSSIETWEHKRKEGYQGTMVSVSFYRLKRKYKITRCKNYSGLVGGAKGSSRLVIERDGEILWPHLKDKRDIQKALTDLLGFSHNLFINSIVFPQKVTRFIESSGPERKRVFDEAFKMLWIKQALTIATAQKQEIVTRVRVLDASIDGETRALTSLAEILKTMDKAKEEFEEDKIKTLGQLTQDIQTLEAESEAKQQQVKPILATETELLRDKGKLETDPLYLSRNQISIDLNLKLPERTRIQRDLRENEAELSKALSKRVVKCPKCSQALPKKDSKEYIQSLRDTQITLQDKLIKVKPEVTQLSDDMIKADKLAANLKNTEDDLRGIGKALTKARETNLLIEASRGRLEELNKQLRELKASEYTDLSAPVRNKEFILEKSLKKLQKNKGKLNKKLEIYSWLISGPLGPSGIQAFMFSRLVELVNFQLLILEKFTGFGVTLSIEGSGVRKNIEAIVSRGGFPVAYPDLSGGEGNLVNVMISLAIGEVVTSESPINIRIFDESFESLSKDNVEIVAGLLSQITPMYLPLS